MVYGALPPWSLPYHPSCAGPAHSVSANTHTGGQREGVRESRATVEVAGKGGRDGLPGGLNKRELVVMLGGGHLEHALYAWLTVFGADGPPSSPLDVLAVFPKFCCTCG